MAGLGCDVLPDVLCLLVLRTLEPQFGAGSGFAEAAPTRPAEH
jgi:hypothetical protein